MASPNDPKPREKTTPGSARASRTRRLKPRAYGTPPLESSLARDALAQTPGYYTHACITQAPVVSFFANHNIFRHEKELCGVVPNAIAPVAHTRVTRFPVSLRLMMLCVWPGSMRTAWIRSPETSNSSTSSDLTYFNPLFHLTCSEWSSSVRPRPLRVADWRRPGRSSPIER